MYLTTKHMDYVFQAVAYTYCNMNISGTRHDWNKYHNLVEKA